MKVWNWKEDVAQMEPLTKALPAPENHDARTISEKTMGAVDSVLEQLDEYRVKEAAHLETLKMDRDTKNKQIKESEQLLKETEDNIRDVRQAAERVAVRIEGKPHTMKDIVDSLEPEIARIGQEAG